MLNLDEIKKILNEHYGSSFFTGEIFETNKFNADALIAHSKRNKTKYLFWQKPSESFTFFAYGQALEFSGEKEALIEEIEKIKVNSKFYYENCRERKIPFVVGGVKFNNGIETVWQDFNFNEWFIPRFIFIRTANKYLLAINYSKIDNPEKIKKELDEIWRVAFDGENFTERKNLIGEPEFISEIDKAEWNKKINKALDLIERNVVSKIVISRYIHYEFSQTPNNYALLSRLAENFPYCTIFGFGNNDSFFFGATPETLFTVNHSSLETDALAGSISRGKTIYEDENLANELLTSDKNLREHKKVVEFILSKLEKHARTIVYRDTPKIRKLRNIQHLWTPIKAALNENISFLSVLYDLHPTPAVCGSPKETAYEKIHEIENFERGLFTGVIGWFNFNEMADFSVAIRSALIKKSSLYAYAGCGIVKGSNADDEFAETQLKLKPILSLFGENEY